jgi:NAD(P)-dependent dehydrogenase (short-subunit alcohol dehydrogenase family)
MSYQNQNGKVHLITGATSGIGRMVAFGLAELGAEVIVASRDQEKCVSTVDWIIEKTGNPLVQYAVVDLSDQGDIHRFARSIHERFDRLDVLINNAGSFFITRRENTAGMEMTFALNHLGYFSTTLLLLDLLKASAPSRIINVTSGMHRNTELDFEDFQFQSRYRPFEAYGQSKLANILFTHEIARRLDPSQVTVNSLHPGAVATNIASDNALIGPIARLFMAIIGKSAEEGAVTPIYLAASEEVAGFTGHYFVDCDSIASAPHSYDEQAEQRLWELSLEMTGIHDPT